MGNERRVSEAEPITTNRVFYFERDFYSRPEVIIITAPNLEEAERILNEQLQKEHDPRGAHGKLTELDLTRSTTTTLHPLGDNHLTH